MMSKRRRASSVTSHGADGDESDTASEVSTPAPPPSGRKKKRLDPGEICQQLYDTIRSFKKEDGSLLCDAFIRAPKRRQEPQYYDVVSQPIDLLRVQQKLKTDTYEDIEELTSDIELLVNNAKAFYKSDTTEYKDAKSLWTLFNQTRQSLENGEEIRPQKQSRLSSTSRKSTSNDTNEGDLSETSTINDDDNVCEDLFSSVTTASIDGRALYPAFRFLPSKKRYPEYYDVIDSPIDLKTIARKIQDGKYGGLVELERDLVLMTRNACSFNEPGSQIYKDAKTLKKIIQTRRQELEQHGRAAPSKTSERIRSKRGSRLNPAPTSADMAALQPDQPEPMDIQSMEEREVERDSEESEAEEEKREVDKDDPQWKLLETVKNVMGPNGQPMSEPFSSLPSRRYYPDYYKQIKNPVSLNQIRNKIKRGDYGTLSEVAGDMNIMFENAKQYNVATSKLYKDAVKLQRIMQQSVQEMLDIVQSSSSDDESLSSVKSQTTPRGRGRRPQQPIASSPALNVSNLGSNLVKNPMPLRKKLHLLQKHMLEATCSDGRQPMLLFMEKPSKKIYPDYYTVIDKPIDMLGIEANIKNERYQSLDEIVADFKLMFSNCRQYNEEGSMIYEDANMLERVLNEKVRDLSGAMVNEKKVQVKVFKAKTKQLTPIEQKLRTLYDAVRDYRDPKANRQLALVFMKLPNKNEYPDYYELIKNPIDMEKIAAKLKNGGYNTVNELASDFVLMFDNACKYNEPDSQIYKDALLLQRVCLQTKQMLREDEDTVPDVGAAVQELLLTLFTTVYNHQDEEGRCYSDSMAELPEHDENAAGEKVRAISLDLIKRRLDKGLYKRLDHFQEDMFVVLDRARRLTRTDSQVFEDSVELQSYFIVTRDQLCKDGAVLHSPALLYDKEMMINAMESVKHSKLLQENTDDDETRSSSDDTMMSVGTDADGAEQPQHLQYSKGDFVYLTPGKGDQASILQVERIWTNADDVAMVHGYCYFRPHETYHVQTRRFLEQEVFKSDAKKSVPLEQISGRCYVMNVKEYFKYQPEGYPDKDVYVCESRYSTRTRSFKKIKVWEGATREPNLRAREPALEPNRSFSVFQQRLEKHRDELAELDHLENVQEKERPNVQDTDRSDVVMYNPLGSEDENTYYEQYNTVCSGVIKTGDFVYVVTDGGKQMIAQVDTIWETKDNKCYFRGPFLIFPAEVASIINKPFYKQEVLLTTVHDSSPLVGIVGKCSVLYYDDYLKCRPTEIAEADIFVCESLYDESSRVARKLKSGLRHYEHAKDVTVDEIYYFSKPLGPPALASARDVENQVAVVMQQGEAKMAAATHHMIEQKPQFTNLINTTIGSQDVESLLESSLDSSSMASAASLASPATPAPAPAPTPAPTPAPSSSKKRKEPGKKLVTGYILYSSEMRKQIIASHPESTFGDISRIVGNDWRSLPAATKQHWEEKAAQCNEEAAAKLQKELKENGGNLEMIYECGWDSCEYQFEDHSDLTEHCIGEAGGTGHIQAHCTAAVAALPPGATMEYQCLWRSCHRVKRGQAPFPNMQRIVRHVRDLHINKGNGRLIQSQEKSRNYVPSRRKAAASAAAMTALAGLQQGVAGGQGSPCGAVRSTPSPGHAGLGGVGLSGGGDGPRGLDPLFVSAPPRPQRVTHSEAYIRYIEGLHSEQKYITPWEKSIAPTPPNPDPCHYNINKLPSNWLSEEALANYAQSQDKPDGPKPEPNANLVKALWALRDFMMKDAFAINKNL